LRSHIFTLLWILLESLTVDILSATSMISGMTVRFHPEPGTIVRVDLSDGFRPPEMGKRRPAVVVSPELADRPQMCTIIPLSTNPPKPPRSYHHRLVLDSPLPPPYDKPEMWAKCDVLLTVAFHRLRLLSLGRDDDGERIYDVRRIPDDDFRAIRRCALISLGLGPLTIHL
jgi:mRNA interferase MazF